MIAEKYWPDIRKGQISLDGAAQRLAGVCNMLLPETFAQDCKARWATLAWCNGARLRAHSNRLSNRAIGESHHHEPEAISLMKDVLDRLDGMGLPDDPLDQLRDTISEMVGSDNPGPASPEFLELCAHAGWQSVEQGSLFAAHVLGDLKNAGHATQYLTDLLITEHGGLTEQEKGHAFSFFSAATYPTTPVERAALTTAIAGSFREVCEHDLDEVAFLNHGFQLGKELACTDADAAREVMNDIGPDPLRITLELIDEYLDCHFSEAGPGDFFNSMLRWMKKTYPDLSETDYPPFKALLLRHAYDYMFWAGLLLEMRPEIRF